MKYLSLQLVLLLFACNSSTEPKHEPKQKTETQDSIVTSPAVTSAVTTIPETGTNCNRGEPQPLVKKGNFSNATFELQANKQIGIETFQNENREKITIRNWGCEYVALTFRFETSRFEAELSNTGFWYKRTATLLNEINAKLQAPVDIVKGTERISTEIENNVPNGYANLKLNEELDFEDNPRSFVRIDKIEKLDGQKIAIEVTFAKGPL